MEKKMYKIEIKGDVNEYVLGRISGIIAASCDEGQIYPNTVICDVSKYPWRKHKVISNEMRVDATADEFQKCRTLINKYYPNLCTYFCENG